MRRTRTAAAAPACLAFPFTAPLTRMTPNAERANPTATSNAETVFFTNQIVNPKSIEIIIPLGDHSAVPLRFRGVQT